MQRVIEWQAFPSPREIFLVALPKSAMGIAESALSFGDVE
jgi:hypothetical protein